MTGSLLSDADLALLACPQDHSALRWAPPALIAHLNAEIVRKSLRDASGQLVQHPFDAGLLRADGERLYSIVQGLAVLRVEAAIVLTDHERSLGRDQLAS